MNIEGTERIMVVDDDPRNVRLMEGIFRSAGYPVEKAYGGQEALDLIAASPPDLVLLDVMMPGISGHEVCRRLKDDARTRSIPVVLVTALSAVEDKVEGLDRGADDFVSKPVNRIELLAKTRSLLRIKSLHDQLARANDQLAEKNRELMKLERLKETLVQMIVHDLKNPLTAIMGNLGLILRGSGGEDRTLQRARIAMESCRVMMRMALDLLDIGRIEEHRMSVNRMRLEIPPLVEATIAEAEGIAAQSKVVVRSELAAGLRAVDADGDLIGRILANLLSNAIKHTPELGTIQIGGENRDGEVVLYVRDTGEGIPAEYHGLIFDKYSQVEAKKMGLKTDRGLGLTFCKMAIEAHGGRIWVESEEGSGSTFLFALPPFAEKGAGLAGSGQLSEPAVVSAE